MADYSALSLAELDDRMAIVRDNIRQLIEQAAAASGERNEERVSERLAQQNAELEALSKARDALWPNLIVSSVSSRAGQESRSDERIPRRGEILVLDMASTLFFLALFFLTHNTLLSVSLGIALGVAQIGFQLHPPKARRHHGVAEPVPDHRRAASRRCSPTIRASCSIKPSVFYLIIGVVMLKPGWLNRYLPDIVKQLTPDVATAVGYYWAALMFVSAGVNAYVALTRSLAEWAMFMPIYGIVSKVIVFGTGFAIIRFMTRRRIRALPEPQREALLASTGYQNSVASNAG